MATAARPDPGLDRYYAAPQTLVKISQRRRLNLLVTGEGSPTVILAPGGGGCTTLEWRRVQHAIPSLSARTVCFDYAGLGFSEPGPLPRTGSAIVNDLRAALKAADMPPPYVLAGWSLGGLYMRLFAFRYPQEVVGMVMVDSSTEHQTRRWRAAMVDQRLAQTRREQQEEYLRTLSRVERLAREGRLLPGTPEYDKYVGAPEAELTPAVEAARVAQLTSPGYWRALKSESATMMAATSDEIDAARRQLGNMPLVVLSAGELAPVSGVPAEVRRELHRTMHEEIAALSTRGQRRTIDNAGHAIQMERPEVVVAAIEEVLAMARDG